MNGILFLLPLGLLPLTMGFSFSFDQTNLTTCGTVGISWSGGTPPFYLTILPIFDYPFNTTIPSSSWNSAQSAGSYQYTVNYPSGKQFVALMSDASGFGTGGVSPLYSVGSGSSTCTLRSTSTDFLFYLNSTSVTQCTPLEIYWDSTAVAPVTIVGAIPGGQAFLLNTNSKSTSVMWNANIAAGTQFILSAFDSGSLRQGGSSALLRVQSGSSSSCLNDSSPSSTVGGTATASTTATRTGGGGGVKTVTAIATAVSGSGLSTGSIVGIVVAVVMLVLILQIVLVWFCCRRQLQALLTTRRQQRQRQNQTKAGDVDLLTASTAGGEEWSSHPNSPNPGSGTSPSGRGSVDESVSPFWDGAAISPHSHSQGYSPSQIGNPYGGGGGGGLTPEYEGGSRSSTPGERALLAPRVGVGSSSSSSPVSSDPPRLPHLRTDSLGSMMFDHPLSEAYDAISPIDSSTRRTSFTTSQSQFFPSNTTTTAPVTGSSPAAGTGMGPSRPSKAQLAGLSASNPDPGVSPVTRVNNRMDEISRLPPMSAPRGGFRRHEDAGRLDIEDLPPLYEPEWQVRRDGGGGQG